MHVDGVVSSGAPLSASSAQCSPFSRSSLKLWPVRAAAAPAVAEASLLLSTAPPRLSTLPLRNLVIMADPTVVLQWLLAQQGCAYLPAMLVQPGWRKVS